MRISKRPSTAQKRRARHHSRASAWAVHQNVGAQAAKGPRPKLPPRGEGARPCRGEDPGQGLRSDRSPKSMQRVGQARPQHTIRQSWSARVRREAARRTLRCKKGDRQGNSKNRQTFTTQRDGDRAGEGGDLRVVTTSHALPVAPLLRSRHQVRNGGEAVSGQLRRSNKNAYLQNEVR